jgi:uncharacterized protein YeaO (DUF488 family)
MINNVKLIIMFYHDKLTAWKVILMLKIKGIYELPKKEDGFRILIDESWPSNMSSKEAKIDLWLKDIYPPDSSQLSEDKLTHSAIVNKKDPAELWKNNPIKFIRDTEKKRGTVTFLCSNLQSLKRLQF